MSVDSVIEQTLRETYRDGHKDGVAAAIFALEGAQKLTAEENQTWTSAIAFLRLVEEKIMSAQRAAQ